MTRATILLLVLLPLAVLIVPAYADEMSIGQKDKQFSRDSVSIKHGDSLRFVNDDDVTHNIAVHDPDGTGHSGHSEAPGADLVIPFDQIGDYQVRCLIHPKMKMTVHVE